MVLDRKPLVQLCMWRPFFVAVALLLSIQSAIAATYRLFSNGEQVADYNEIIRTLKHSKQPFAEPTFLQFDRQPAIQITRFLGNGGLTAVFLRADGRALRVPLSSGNAFFRNGPNGELKDNGPYTKGMTSFLIAMTKLEDVEDLAPKIYRSDSFAPQFITVDFYNAQFSIEEFYFRRAALISRGLLQPEGIETLEANFKKFVLSLAGYKIIGDFKTTQVMSDGKTWRLLDNSDPVRKAEKVDDPTPFDHRNMGPKLPPEVWASITEMIRHERSTNPHVLAATAAQGSVISCRYLYAK